MGTEPSATRPGVGPGRLACIGTAALSSWEIVGANPSLLPPQKHFSCLPGRTRCTFQCWWSERPRWPLTFLGERWSDSRQKQAKPKEQGEQEGPFFFSCHPRLFSGRPRPPRGLGDAGPQAEGRKNGSWWSQFWRPDVCDQGVLGGARGGAH